MPPSAPVGSRRREAGRMLRFPAVSLGSIGARVSEAAEDVVGARNAVIHCGAACAREVGEYGGADIRHVADAATVEFSGHHLLEDHLQLRAGHIRGREASDFERNAQRAACREAVEGRVLLEAVGGKVE